MQGTGGTRNSSPAALERVEEAAVAQAAKVSTYIDVPYISKYLKIPI